MNRILAWSAGFACWIFSAPWWAVCALGIPAILVIPGWEFARWRDPKASALQSLVDAAWIGIGLSVLGVTLARLSGFGAAAIWATSGIALLIGFRVGKNPAKAALPSPRAIAGIFVLAATIATLAIQNSPALSRGLDVGWYHKDAQSKLGEQTPLHAESGWTDKRWIAPPSEGALALTDSEGDGGLLKMEASGPLLVLLRGPIDAQLRLTDSDGQVRIGTIQADVTEEEEEGPVPRYLKRGMVGVWMEAQAGDLHIQLQGTGPNAELYVLPGQEAIWALDRSGEARFLHYYQLLNKVENQRWAVETLVDRNLTINQPPLWSTVLAVPTALTDGEIRGANLLFLFVLLLIGITGLALIEAAAPDAPWGGWALPGLYTGVLFHMMMGPGSTNFPDTLYTAALLAGLLALLRTSLLEQPNRFAGIGLAAGLLRYPGTIVLTLWALLQKLLLDRKALPAITRLWTLVALVAISIGLAGAVTGQLGEWLDILWFETGPEHYQNNQEAPPLLQRPQVFYTEWANIMGFRGSFGLAAWAMIAAAVLWADRNARWVLSCVLIYSLLLCTIDHFPSHYFLPLVAGMGVSMGMACRRIPKGLAREIAGAALAGFVLIAAF
jgi:hypothetical protein